MNSSNNAYDSQLILLFDLKAIKSLGDSSIMGAGHIRSVLSALYVFAWITGMLPSYDNGSVI